MGIISRKIEYAEMMLGRKLTNNEAIVFDRWCEILEKNPEIVIVMGRRNTGLPFLMHEAMYANEFVKE